MNPIVFVVLAAILIGGAFYLVALPILQHARQGSSPPSLTSEQERLEDLFANRDTAFQALRELNFDHRVGKITDEDFVAFEAHLKRNAAGTLRALDEWEGEADSDFNQVIERAVQARKQRLISETVAGGSDEAGAWVCSRCGKPAFAADRFCGGCGEPLRVSCACG
jgi:rubrerythrin